MRPLEKKLYRVALFILAFSLFPSISISAVSYIILVPLLLYSLRFYKNVDVWRQLPTSTYMLMGLLVSGGISLFLNQEILGNPIKQWGALKYLFVGAFSVYPFSLYLKSEEKSVLKKMGLLFLITTTAATLSGLVGVLTGFNPLRLSSACHATRNCGMNGMYMSYGYGIGFFLICLIGFALVRGRKKLTSILVINIVGTVLSYARGTLVALMVTLPFILLRYKKKFLFVLYWPLLLLSIWGLYQFNPKVKELISSPQRIESNMIRLSNFEAVFYSFQEKPFFGQGYRNFEYEIGRIKAENEIPYPHFHGHAHNNILEILASVGGVGALFFLLFHFFWIKELLERKDLMARSLVMFPFFVLIAGLFQYTFGDAQNMFFMMLFYPLSQVVLWWDEREISFVKYEAAGNDFVVLDGRRDDLQLTSQEVSFLSHRRLGIGSDGVIFLRSPCKMDYLNSDGKRVAMCGNGLRALTHFIAKHLHLPLEKKETHYQIQLPGGIYKTKLLSENEVEVEMSEFYDTHKFDGMKDLMPLYPAAKEAFYLNSGVPHLLFELSTFKELEELNIVEVGRSLRHHHLFSPEGVNVNFFAHTGENEWSIRTYERGVEDETFACGTGAIALIYALRKDHEGHYTIKTKLHLLKATVKDGCYFLTGPVNKVFEGKVYLS